MTKDTDCTAPKKEKSLLILPSCGVFLNPCRMHGLAHHYHLGESTFIFRGIRSDFLFFISFFDEIPLSKQNSPKWEAAFCENKEAVQLCRYCTTSQRLCWQKYGDMARIFYSKVTLPYTEESLKAIASSIIILFEGIERVIWAGLL